MKFWCVALLVCHATLSLAEPTSPSEVLKLAKALGLNALSELPEKNQELYNLGERLFFDKNLSGNRNISCSSCHDPKLYSTDGLSLALGEGTDFTSPIQYSDGPILKRHTPNLINLGRPEIRQYFWDGRVAQAPNDAFYTPEQMLNGSSPELNSITSALSGPLAAQALFPLINHQEMLGQVGESPLASLNTSEEQWQAIVDRIVVESASDYQHLIENAFPNLQPSQFNIGHAATALAEFQRYFFTSTKTPFDQFMLGDLGAMDLQSIHGLNTFMTAAKCVTCHAGPHLSNFQFQSSGSPQISLINQWNDEGRKEVTKKGRDRFKFKTPGLRNIELTPPYMHSGSLQSLESVIEHYNDIQGSLTTYDLTPELKSFYLDQVAVDSDGKRNELRLLQVEGTAFLLGLKLTDREKRDLLHFLRVGLTDTQFKSRMDQYLPPTFESKQNSLENL